MNIRNARPEDIPSILAMERQFPSLPHWSEEAYAGALATGSANRIMLVAEVDGAIRASLVARFTVSECELESIMVCLTHHRQGIATQLLEQLLATARECGVPTVHLEVRQSNTAAQALYVKLGFVEVGRRKNYYRNPPEDAVLYSLEL